MANAGGSCPAFASRVGISTSNLYAWNPVLGSSGQNCASQFWGNTYYCVAVSPNYPSTTVKPTTTGAAPAPGPTQSGIISTCSKYLMANSGGSCPVFAQRAGISTSQLYAWNSVLGKNGENCASQFWANTYYCVGVRSSKARRNAAAEITGYALPPAYISETFGTIPKTTGASMTSPTAAIGHTTVSPSDSSSQTTISSMHSTSAPTHGPGLLSNSTLATISTSFVIPIQHSASVGVGYPSSNTTTVATGTGVPKPGYTTATIHPYTGAGSATQINVGLVAILASAGFLLL